ncbi:MAG: tyrosine-type recombinase/integrase [Candidatus Omnitrophota bacterium]|nr:tyrosine-type recombinase/integrase [Candidatus Omnitrophota bacterium]
MATLRKRNGTYYIDCRVGGKRLRKSVGKSKKIADLAHKDLEVKLARGEHGFARQDGTYDKLLNSYESYCKTNLAPGTQKRYGAITDNFQRFLDSGYPHLEKISQFTPRIFEKFKAFRKEEEAHNKTINNELTVLRTMFKLAVQWGYTQTNPTDGVSKLKIARKIAPRFLREEECRLLLDNSGEWLRPIFFAFLNTGMRKSELENLEWSDIDFNRRKIKIRAKDDWSPKTNEREIPINEGLYGVLKEQKRIYKDSNNVFPGEDGRQIFRNRLLRRLKTLAKRLKLGDVTIHMLRHTFASQLVMKGVDLATVRQLLGHSDIQTTMIYSHLADEHVDKAVDKLEF